MPHSTVMHQQFCTRATSHQLTGPPGMIEVNMGEDNVFDTAGFNPKGCQTFDHGIARGIDPRVNHRRPTGFDQHMHRGGTGAKVLRV
jgi:hypothetical protein